MNQVIHIFRKDARHLWVEIVVSLTLLAAYAWREPRYWGAQRALPDLLEFLWRLVVPLVPVAWCFLIVRAVHDESLVGDRQFWVTRPYEWRKLLAAKLLFVAVFINAPALIVGIILLKKAGFSPFSYIPGLLWMQLLLTLFMTLTAVAAASITATIAQVLLVVLVVVLYFIGAASLFSVIPNSSMSSASSIPGSLPAVVLLGACVAVVLWQYARRRTWRSRELLFGAAGLIVIISAATPYGAIVAREYPQLPSGQRPPVTLDLGPAPIREQKNREPVKESDVVNMNLPLRVTGMSEGSVIIIDGTLVTIEVPGEKPWSSEWRGAGTDLWPERGQSAIAFELPGKFFNRVKSSPSKLHISFALTVYREDNIRTLSASGGEFRVPDVGICSANRGWNAGVLQCRSPLKKPALIASISSSTMTCPPASDKLPLPPGIRLTAENWSDTSGPAEVGISPVETLELYFWNWADPNSKFSSPGICPGTPVTLSKPVMVQRLRSEVEFGGLQLADYAWERGSNGSVGWEVGFHVR